MEVDPQAIIKLAMQGNLNELKKICQEHSAEIVRVDKDPEELTALHMASAAGQEQVVNYLLSETIGADANAARGNNFTPLHSAAMHGHASICSLLLKHGADPNVQTDPQGYAPIHSASFAGHLTAIQILFESGARLDLRNYRDEKPVDTATRQGEMAAIELLKKLEAG